MSTTDEAEMLVKQGKLAEALASLQAQVRARPADAKLRVFLFQLLCLGGQWERALTQLNLSADMDPANLLMAQVGRPALQCEALRAEIFAGKRAPLVFGQPAEWVGLMVQANQLLAQGHVAQSQELRDRALEAAPAVTGSINGVPFEWIADADPRLGPMLEALIDGRYFWVPFPNVSQILMEPPADLRDLVWAPARFVWANGGSTVGFIPARYPGTESADDPALRMARKTEWIDRGGDLFVGLGQRLLATDQGEYPLLETRSVVLNVAGAGPAPTPQPAPEASA